MPDISTFNYYLFDHTNTPGEEGRKAIEERVWKDFGAHGSVMVLDMSGFSRTSEERGIVYYLALVHRMQIIVEPIVQKYGGKVVKFEADNCFARFQKAENAADAAIGIQIAVAAANRTTPEDIDIELSIGIDHGDYLLIEGKDFFGNPVNRASKLGEDLGGAGDILLTEDAMRHIKNRERLEGEAVEFSISGIALKAFRIHS